MESKKEKKQNICETVKIEKSGKQNGIGQGNFDIIYPLCCKIYKIFKKWVDNNQGKVYYNIGVGLK